MATTEQLKDPQQLRAEADAVLATTAASATAHEWYEELLGFIRSIRGASSAQLTDRMFLEKLWNDNPVASVGMGTVGIKPALDSAEFRVWFAETAKAPLPVDPIKQEAHLVNVYDEIVKRMQAFGIRVARLKINRVLCALFPEHFTTIANEGALRVLHRAMGGASSDHPVHAHKTVRARIDEALGPPEPTINIAYVQRVCLAWYLYERVLAQADQSNKIENAPTTPTESALKPLPAIRRARGLLSMKGYFPFLLGIAQELERGINKEEFAVAVRSDNPALTDGSVNTIISALRREFDVFIREGDTYWLSARGFNLLESGDPDELADFLTTHILGIDNILVQLREKPVKKLATFAFLRGVNPGWTTNFSPSATMAWLVSLGVVSLDTNGDYALTDRGKTWAALVTWTPESLPALPSETEEPSSVASSVAGISLELPTFADADARLSALVSGKLTYPAAVIRELHAGLWFHPRRHFAVLTGLSGSGKTQLAAHYAMALCGDTVLNSSKRILVIPVQPSWFDPIPLFGYVNPLERGYRTAPFLELLQRASEDPTQPYLAILDEMNLSHPEQYLAPVLSAMETGANIEIHNLSPEMTDIPQRIPYPPNLAIIGTVNMDETTHGLSDKVLDRAYTIEFWAVSVADFPHWGSSNLPTESKEATKRVLRGLSAALSPVRLHFGWRTISDVLSYMEFSTQMNADSVESLDAAVYAKVLPKLRGEESKGFRAALNGVIALLGDEKLSRSKTKVLGLLDDLSETGTARFWR